MLIGQSHERARKAPMQGGTFVALYAIVCVPLCTLYPIRAVFCFIRVHSIVDMPPRIGDISVMIHAVWHVLSASACPFHKYGQLGSRAGVLTEPAQPPSGKSRHGARAALFWAAHVHCFGACSLASKQHTTPSIDTAPSISSALSQPALRFPY